MVVINQIQPVNVMFTVPEKYLSEVRKHMTAGKLGVEAFLSAEDKVPAKGSLSFIENTVDTTTGTIMMKASFPNQDRRLWPGQFVNVVMTLAVQQDAVVVPSSAVQTGQQGQFVYAVKGDTAELRPVTAGVDYEGMTVIEKGIASGEQVVTDGQIRLLPGAKIVIRTSGQQGQGPTAAGPAAGQAGGPQTSPAPAHQRLRHLAQCRRAAPNHEYFPSLYKTADHDQPGHDGGDDLWRLCLPDTSGE